MSRQPVVAGDNGGWGAILNDYLSQQHSGSGAHTGITANTLTIATVPSTSQMATLGGSAALGYQVSIGGQWSPVNGGQAAAFLVAAGITGATNQSAALAIISSTAGITKAGAGTHTLFAGAWVDDLKVNAGAATLTNAASLYVANRPTAGSASNLYPVWVAGAGGSQFDSDGTDVELKLNRTVAGNAAQLQFTRSGVVKAYLGLTAANDFQFLDNGAVQRAVLYNAGAFAVGTAPANTGVGTINVANGYYANGSSGVSKTGVTSTFTNMTITNGIITSITT